MHVVADVKAVPHKAFPASGGGTGTGGGDNAVVDAVVDLGDASRAWSKQEALDMLAHIAELSRDYSPKLLANGFAGRQDYCAIEMTLKPTKTPHDSDGKKADQKSASTSYRIWIPISVMDDTVMTVKLATHSGATATSLGCDLPSAIALGGAQRKSAAKGAFAQIAMNLDIVDGSPSPQLRAINRKAVTSANALKAKETEEPPFRIFVTDAAAVAKDTKDTN